jgi:hypothetical protein
MTKYKSFGRSPMYHIFNEVHSETFRVSCILISLFCFSFVINVFMGVFSTETCVHQLHNARFTSNMAANEVYKIIKNEPAKYLYPKMNNYFLF